MSPTVLSSTPSTYPPSGISVNIVGAGIGGLTAALECSRKGHQVQIFDSQPSPSKAGDQIFLGLSGSRFLKHWPLLGAELSEIATKGICLSFLKHNGEVLVPPLSFSQLGLGDKPPVKMSMANGTPPPAPVQIYLREQLHTALYRQLERLNLSVQFNKRVIAYSDDSAGTAGSVTFADGTSSRADLIIAADGINSKSQELINRETIRGKSSGRAVYRAAFPTEVGLRDPLVKANFGLMNGIDAITRSFMGPGIYGVVLSRPDKICYTINYNEKNSSTATKESWHAPISPSDVLETLEKTPGWSEPFKALIAATPEETILNWPLVLDNPRAMWRSPAGRILQLGDAAHAFLPASGSGATQAMEDAATIATCLERCNTNGTVNVPQAVHAHNILRFERVACAQLLGFVNAAQMQHTDFDAINKDPSKALPKAPKWVWMHDPERYAEEMYDGVVRAIVSGEEGGWRNTNTPPGWMGEEWTIQSVGREGVKLSGDWT